MTMTQQAIPSESQHQNDDWDERSRPGWWLVLLSSGLCVAGTAVAIVLTVLF
jgi:hypothetical protein